MITVRRSSERGYFDHGWLKSHHSFSFAGYYDPAHMGFRSLRVINEDTVAPGKGFGEHPHRDMEIITYVLDGALSHRDSMGNGSTIRPGEVQYMSAGTGVVHAEFNQEPDQPVHLIQIWIQPDRKGYSPTYGQRTYVTAETPGGLRLMVSNDGRDGTIKIRQDADIWSVILSSGTVDEFTLRPGRGAWIQVLCGSAEVNGHLLTGGDGAAVEHEQRLRMVGGSDGTELLLFDLA